MLSKLSLNLTEKALKHFAQVLNFNFICIIQMNLSYTDKKINYSNVLFKYYFNIILISIDGKSREDVHSD